MNDSTKKWIVLIRPTQPGTKGSVLKIEQPASVSEEDIMLGAWRQLCGNDKRALAAQAIIIADEWSADIEKEFVASALQVVPMPRKNKQRKRRSR